jgi:hypothetical protein
MNIGRFNFVVGQYPMVSDPVAKQLQESMQLLERRIAKALSEPSPKTQQVYLTQEPDNPGAGDVVLADGIGWDPGSGEGLYLRDEANAAWVFLTSGGSGSTSLAFAARHG